MATNRAAPKTERLPRDATEDSPESTVLTCCILCIEDDEDSNIPLIDRFTLPQQLGLRAGCLNHIDINYIVNKRRVVVTKIKIATCGISKDLTELTGESCSLRQDPISVGHFATEDFDSSCCCAALLSSLRRKN